MKFRHLLLTLVLTALLAVSAAAYQVPNRETNPLSPYYDMNTDQEDQADFLKALGLFRGTNKGYELDRSMNRCEAGTMLVRLLGKESEALEENNNHPFTDVPQWADPYIGWLWENGLTKGMSDTVYGAKKSVTAEQYLIFLSRVLQGSDVADDWWESGFGDEMASLQRGLDRQGFLRGDAVSLSVWALQSRTENGKSLAMQLLEDGIFSQDVFLTSAFPIYDSSYYTDSAGHLVRSTAGVQLVGQESGLTLLNSSEAAPRRYLYCMREEEVNGPRLMTADGVTLELGMENIFFSGTLEPLLEEHHFSYLLSHGDWDYFRMADQLYAYDGAWFQRVICEEQPLEGFSAFSDRFHWDDSILTVRNGDMVWLIDGAKATYLSSLQGYSVFDVVDRTVLAKRFGWDDNEIVAYAPSTGTLTVLLPESGYTEVLDDGLYQIDDGLWRYTGGKLVQLAELEGVPILDAISDEKGGVYILTYNDASTPGILHVSASGAVSTALSPDCGHGLEITNLDGIRPDGSLQFRFYQMEPMGNHETTVCRYALEREGDRPAIRVLSLSYAHDNWYLFESGVDRDAFYEARIERIQQELNDLGLGIA